MADADFHLDVLYEDNHLLAINKPAALATMGTPSGKPTLLIFAKDYIKKKYCKPGNVYLGIMSRLDAPTTGVVVVARTSKAAKRLTDQFRAHTVEKVYWALVEGQVEPSEDECVDWLGADKRHRKMQIVGSKYPGAVQARLSYRKRGALGKYTLLEVFPETGRKHQIRLQLSHRNWPIVGDRKYGAISRWPSGIALHARKLVVNHPTTGKRLTIEAPLNKNWRQVGVTGYQS